LAREGILAKLQHTLEHQGPKAVIGHRGYARLLEVAKGSVTLDQAALAKEARLDGKFVLRTNTRLSADEVARAYKSLWRVERSFREVKSTLSVRPVYHQRDDSVIGHIVGCFLALRLEVDLQRRLDDQRLTASWPDLMSDLTGSRRCCWRSRGSALDSAPTSKAMPTKPAAPPASRSPSKLRRSAPCSPTMPTSLSCLIKLQLCRDKKFRRRLTVCNS